MILQMSFVYDMCRRLLGLLVPYDVKMPEFADLVHPKELGKQLAPLWMCYWYVCWTILAAGL